jgi:hypothetical protein
VSSIRRVRVVAFTVGVLATTGVAPASAQTAVRTEVDTTLVTVGDRITMTVTVEHAPGTRAVWPDSLTLEPFEVLNARALPTRSGDGVDVSSLLLSLAAFELGELEIPAFEVAVVGPEDEVEVVETDRYVIEVASVGSDETGDIRDIRGPLSIPLSVLRVLSSAAVVLLLAMAALALYRRFRGRGGSEEPRRRGPLPRAAHELALEALAALESSPLLERGQVKEYHIAVSEILRTYVERRFRVDALEMTTVEVLAGLEEAGVDGEFRDGLRRFLDQCDLVKFAKVRPGEAASREVLALGRYLVEQTIPEVPIPDVDVDGEVSDRGADGARKPPEEVGSVDDSANAAAAQAG